MKRAFITGGSGFVGRRVIAILVERGIPVRALARSEQAAITVRLRGDLDDVAPMTAGMRGCDVVIHAAAHVKQHGPLAELMKINVAGTDHVLAAAVKRVVHVSTEAVLADGHAIVRADETRPYPAKPVGPYPFTKSLAEQRVRAAQGLGPR